MKGIYAGMAIGLGAIAYMSTGGFISAILFSIGLLAVLYFGLDLYTGKVCYIKNYSPKLLLILIENFIGAGFMALLAYTHSQWIDAAQLACNIKAGKTWVELLVDGIICGMCIGIAVHGFNQENRNFFIVILAITVFIMSGAEHVIADAFYIILGQNLTWMQIANILGFSLIGNTIGGLFIYCFSLKGGNKR